MADIPSSSKSSDFHLLLRRLLAQRRAAATAFFAARASPAAAASVPAAAEQRLSFVEYRKLVRKTKRKMKRRIEAVRVGVEEREARKREEEEEDEEENELEEIERKLRQHETLLEKERELARREKGEKEKDREGVGVGSPPSRVEIEPSPLPPPIKKRRPPPPPHSDLTDPRNCDFFMRTGACRFGDACKRLHPELEFGLTVLIPGMFSHAALDAALAARTAAADDDAAKVFSRFDGVGSDLRAAFLDFYEDALPEFEKIGVVKQFKVCLNSAAHLRGNVFVSYEREEEAVVAVSVFRGRWYAGRRLSAQISVVSKWRSAICGQFLQNECPKGKDCNFLHCFVNPEGAFADADRDFEEAGAEKAGGVKRRRRCGREKSPPGKHRPFRFRDHYVEDERIWKRREGKDEEEKGGEKKEKKEKKKKKKKKKEKRESSDSDFCSKSKKKRRKCSSSSSGELSSLDFGSSGSSSSSDDDVEKKILKVTLKTIKTKKKKKKKKKSKKKKKRKNESTSASDAE